MNRQEVLRGVSEDLARVLDVRPETVRASDRLVDDLGADSLDLLDLTFHLEQRFQVPISPRELERRARERLGGAPLERDGIYTPEAVAEFRRSMPEVPPEELPEGLTTAELPRRLRVESMVNLVCQLLEDRDG